MTDIEKKTLVDNIAAEFDTEHAAVVSSANALNILSSQIYAKEDRFIYELLQNACDSALDKADGVVVEISLTQEGCLRFAHNGRPFDARDVRSLCMIGDSTKVDDERQIGYKGIGFKSVFTHSDWVSVQSGGYGFAFDKSHWGEAKRPWQIMPIWLDPVESADATVIELRLHDSSKVAIYLTTLSSHPELILFLPNLAKLHISTGGITADLECRGREGLVTLQNGSADGQYLVRHFDRDVPDEMREGLEGDPNIPDKIRNMSAVPITFALPLSPDGVPGNETQPVYAYYPTDDEIGLPVSVNSCFFTNASRERILEDKAWNRQLLRLVADCLGAWLAELAEDLVMRARMLHILPTKSLGMSSLAKLLCDALEESLPPKPCLPVCGGGLVPVNSTVHDGTGLLGHFAKGSYDSSDGSRRDRILDEVELVDEKLNKFEYGLVSLSMADFAEIVQYLEADVSTPVGNVALAKYLFTAGASARALHNCSWLLGADGKLHKPEELFWQPDTFDTNEQQASVLQFVCSEIDACAKASEELRNWLEQFDVKPINAITLIQKVLMPYLAGGGTYTPDQHDSWLHVAVEARKNGALGSAEYGALKNLHVATKCGQRKPIYKCWLGGFYSGDRGWEDLVGTRPEFMFVAESYPGASIDTKHWAALLRECGAKDDIRIIDEGKVKRSKLPDDYCAWIDAKKIIPSIYMGFTHQHSVSASYAPNVAYSLFEDKEIGARVARRFLAALAKAGASDFQSVTYYVYRRSYTVPSSLMHALATTPVWPASDGHCYNAGDVLEAVPSCLSGLPGVDVPALDMGDVSLPRKILSAAGIQDKPGLKQTLLMLVELGKGGQDPVQARTAVAFLYDRLSAMRDSTPARIDAANAESQQLRLLSGAGSFEKPDALYCAKNADDLLLFEDHERAFCGDLGAQDALAILTDLGVNEVNDADIAVVAEEAEEDVAVALHMQGRAPLFAALRCGKLASQESYESEIQELSDLLSGMRIVRAKYELRDTARDRVKAFEKGCFYDRLGNVLYLAGQWTEPSVRYLLAREVARFLGVAEMAHAVHLLLQLSEVDGKAWLKEDGYSQEIPDPEPQAESAEPENDEPPAETPKEDPEQTIPDPTTVAPPESKRCTSDDYSSEHDATSFAEGLISLLTGQQSSDKGFIYHFTDVENIPGILRDGRIAARGQLDGFSDSAGAGLIARTADRVKQFARFYFRPVTPTQWHNEGLGRSKNGIRAFCPVPIFIRIPTSDALGSAGSQCAVSNGNMASGYSHFGNSAEFLSFFDADHVYARFGTVALETYMSASQQEFLVQDGLDLAAVTYELVCRDEQDKQTLRAVLAGASLDAEEYQIVVDSRCYHSDAPRLRVERSEARAVYLSLAGCRRSVEGDFSVEVRGDGDGSADGADVLEVTFDRAVSISGASLHGIRVYYREAGDVRLVYADALT